MAASSLHGRGMKETRTALWPEQCPASHLRVFRASQLQLSSLFVPVENNRVSGKLLSSVSTFEDGGGANLMEAQIHSNFTKPHTSFENFATHAAGSELFCQRSKGSRSQDSFSGSSVPQDPGPSGSDSQTLVFQSRLHVLVRIPLTSAGAEHTEKAKCSKQKRKLQQVFLRFCACFSRDVVQQKTSSKKEFVPLNSSHISNTLMVGNEYSVFAAIA